jgi:nucleoside-diphosphate-sugar epimerase
MAVMVTGGAGMLGLHVARELAEDGRPVIAYPTSGAPPRAEFVLGRHAPYVKFVAGDILDLAHLRRTADEFGVDAIVHTAALTLESQARERPHNVFSVNVGGTANVLEAARRAKMRRVVYIGSASEYAIQCVPWPGWQHSRGAPLPGCGVRGNCACRPWR